MRICRLCNSIISDGMQFCEECGAKSVIYDNAQYTLDGCPLVLVEQNLMLDEEGTKIVLLFVVNGTQTVNACNITLKCYDQLGDVVADTVVKYNDLCVEKGELFGSGKIIVPMDSDTRKFDVLINKVLLDDGTLWKSEELCQKVSSMAEFSDLLKHHNEELVEDKKREEREKREKACVELWNKIVKMDFVDEKFEVGKREEFKKLALNIDSIISQYPDFIIPEGVRKIPKRAFCDLQCLRSIEIPGTVQCIGREFWGCSNIEKIIIHEGVQEIEAQALFLSIISELGHKLKLVDLPSTSNNN